MTPVFTRSGVLLAASAVAFLAAGASVSAWPLVALGMAQTSALMVLYLVFMPVGALLRRRRLELAWWVPAAEKSGGALLAGRALKIRILLRNRSPFRLTLRRVRLMASQTVQVDDADIAAALPPHHESELQVAATPTAAGYWFLHGMSVQITDRFGLFALQLYYPNLLGIKVFPQLAGARQAIPFRPRTGAFHERAGLRTVRQPGLGSDLREIRDHTPGDPFKRIAWKATARLRKLMVRELESEILVTHWILLDISSTMRAPRAGASKLDYGVSLGASFARAALEAGDRVGLITFDHRIYSRVRPSDGSPQLYRIIERLMELHSVVDEDLTDITDAELYAAVAEYLSYQEGLNVRWQGRPPASQDPAWRRLVSGPRGLLIDADAMERAVHLSLERHPPPEGTWGQAQARASGPLPALLRRFCRLRGLELPYRPHTHLMGKEEGMAEALRVAGASRHSQFVVLISDLEEIGELPRIRDALVLARRRHHSLTVLAPFGPAFLPESDDPDDQRVRGVLELGARRRQDKVRVVIERMGIPVLTAGPRDGLQPLLRRLARLRVLRSGAA